LKTKPPTSPSLLSVVWSEQATISHGKALRQRKPLLDSHYLQFKRTYLPSSHRQYVPLVSCTALLHSIAVSIAYTRTFTDSLRSRYQAKLASRPILTQSVTTAVLFATGDTMAQQLVEKKGWKNHEIARTGRMALYGGGKTPIVFLFFILTFCSWESVPDPFIPSPLC
jgi:hypothetical protein